jgi:hypothetical protein
VRAFPHLLFRLALLLLVIGSLAPAVARPANSVGPAAVLLAHSTIPGDEFWDERFSLEGVSGPVYAVVAYYAQICIGGDFHQVGSLAAENVACWDPNSSAWSALGGGISGPVHAIARGPDGKLYVGGKFNQAGGVSAQNVARWNDATDQWEAVGAGTSGPVYALATAAGFVYAGGHFGQAGSAPANNVARWNTTAQSWSALASGQNNGVSGIVHALATRTATFDSHDVLVGGAFSGIGGVSNVNAHNIAQWNSSTQAWMEVNGSVSGPIYALRFCGGSLFVGGQFSQAGPIAAFNVAAWDPVTTTWSALGQGTSNTVEAIDCIANRVYVGGRFSQAGSVAANHVARWNTTAQSWSALGSGTSGPVFGLQIRQGPPSNDVYVGGSFASAGGIPSRHFGRYTGDADQSNPEDANWDRDLCLSGPNDAVSAIASSGASLYYGGSFTQAGGLSANHIARYDSADGTWSAIGTGVNGTVDVIAVSGDDVYVGGDFSEAGGVAAANIAHWNSASGVWSALGSGTSGRVHAIAFSGGGLVVGGDFTTAGGVTVNNIARWEPGTQSWSPLGTGVWIGMNAPVNALAVSGSDVYAGGSFTYAQDVRASYVARWDGVVWSALGSGLNNHVHALAMQAGELYVGGSFSTAGGSPAYSVARWDGTAWHAMPGLVHPAYTLAFNLGDVYAGGQFNIPGGSVTNGVARWDGSGWLPLGSGVSNAQALAVGSDGLYVGGSFQALWNGLRCNHTSRWQVRTTPPGAGVIAGRVRGPSGAALPAAGVQVCARSEPGCSWLGTTDENGDYQATGLYDGEYLVRAFPPQGLTALPGAPGPVTVDGGSTQQADVDLPVIAPLPAGAALSPSRQTAAGVPLIHWKQATQLSIQGCAGGSGIYQVLQKSVVLASGALSEGTAGLYSASLAPLYPASGYAQVNVDTNCTPLAGALSAAFDVYVDPTGTVTDGSGSPISGARVTLYAYDSATTSLLQVPATDPRLSPATQANPDLTDAGGHFGWDVSAGVYVVRAAKEDCVSPVNPELAYVQTDLVSAPFEWTDLELRLACPAAAGRVYLPVVMR